MDERAIAMIRNRISTLEWDIPRLKNEETLKNKVTELEQYRLQLRHLKSA